MRLNNGQQGFTLIELIAVITIVGILSAIAGPKFIGRDVFEVRGAQGTLLSALRYAQKTAIAQRKTVFVTVNTTAKSLCLGYNASCSNAVIDPATKAAYSKTLSSDTTLTSSNTSLAFDGLGRPVPNASATYTLQNAIDTSQPAKVITVEAETGYVR